MAKIAFVAFLIMALLACETIFCIAAPSKEYAQEKDANTPFTIVAADLEIPWDIAFLPDGDMLVTERVGRLRRIGKHEKTYQLLYTHYGSDDEGGLLGIILHPDFKNNRWLYLYNTVKKNGHTFNQVERYRFDGELKEKTIIIADIPGAKYHDGGRMAFGPDGFLYITTGDANAPALAQDRRSLAGKILRLKDDGSTPEDNPFGNAVYSYGHRNPQGITWDDQKRLWSTEHGPSGISSGFDELNLIVKGHNYGWPLVVGDDKREGMTMPTLHSGPFETWAPASALYYNGSIFFGGLRGQALYEAKMDRNPIVLKEHFKNSFGRIRTLLLGPDGYFYLTTSNRDGRGTVRPNDDKIIRIDPRIFR